MKLISIIAFAAAAFAAATPEAVPQADVSKPLRLSGMALRSTSPFDMKSINARDGKFWIGKKTRTKCEIRNPDVAETCKHANTKTTIFQYLKPLPTFALDTMVPGGQQVYVNKDTGRLRFTAAHSAKLKGTPVRTGFSISAEGYLKFQKADWVACPEGKKGTFGVYAAKYTEAAENGCLSFVWKLTKLDDSVAKAWQYQ